MRCKDTNYFSNFLPSFYFFILFTFLFFYFFITFAPEMNKTRIINIILTLTAVLLAVLCVLSVMGS